MTNVISRGIMMTALTTILMSIVVGQGLYWESTTTLPIAKGEDIHSTSCYQPHMFKQSTGDGATIFRLDKEMIYLINNQEKEYSEMTFAEMEAFTKKANSKLEEQMAEMKKQLENMPPEQRKSMEDMMKSQGMGDSIDAKIDVIKTTESKTISGYACVKYVMKEDEKEIGSIWTTTGVSGFSSMQKDFKEFSQWMAARTSMRGGQMAAAMAKVAGFAIQTTMAGITTIVTKIEKKTIAASEFEVPSGYKKVSPENFMERRHH